MITLKQIKDTGLAEELGLCPTDSRFIALVNQATERLMYAGKWWGTMRRLKLRVFNRRITLPLNVASLEQVSLNGTPELIRGEAFEFMPGGLGIAEDQCNPARWCCGADIVDGGQSPIQNTILHPAKIAAYSDASECTGASVTICGYNTDGDYIRSQDSDGCWLDGVKLMLDGTADTNPPTTIPEFCQVTSIVKTSTNGVVTVATNEGNGTGILLSKMAPKMITSAYRVYEVPRLACVCTDNRMAPVVTGYVKMGFVPVYEDNDILSISSLPAIKDAVWSEYYSTKPDGDAISAARMQKAISMLQAQLQHQRGSGQVNPMNVSDDGTFGASGIQSVYGFPWLCVGTGGGC